MVLSDLASFTIPSSCVRLARGRHRRVVLRGVLACRRGDAMGEADNHTLERSLDEAFARETRIGLQLSVSARATDWSSLLAAVSRPLVLDTDYFVLQLLLLIAFAALLSLSVRQGHQLVDSAVRAARDRAVLARFFPPQLVERLAAPSERLPSVTNAAAVLFVDFARGARALDAVEGFYAVCERIVFEHGGVIDRFVGDPVMATFGVFEMRGQASESAVCQDAWRCARALEQALAQRASGIGLHFGEVVSGEMGSDRQRAFAVVGHTVNVAHRTLDVAIKNEVRIALTEAFVSRLPPELRERLTFLGEVALKGLGPPMRAWAS